ncbi:MAG: heavy metal-associated domain-containing protein, partial [Desulfovibrionaceae bacterium]|nr:heavy metal-associated domain-containing protein [Desulfovibrionaceae bacterium]
MDGKNLSGGQQKACLLRFDITGMHCAACSSRIERVVGKLDGVVRVSVNLATAKAAVWSQAGRSESEMRTAVMERVAALGFTATPSTVEDAAAQYRA